MSARCCVSRLAAAAASAVVMATCGHGHRVWGRNYGEWGELSCRRTVAWPRAAGSESQNVRFDDFLVRAAFDQTIVFGSAYAEWGEMR